MEGDIPANRLTSNLAQYFLKESQARLVGTDIAPLLAKTFRRLSANNQKLEPASGFEPPTC